MKKMLFFFVVFFTALNMTYAQQRSVAGKITGADGAPVPYATIQIKGTTKGTTADASGNFKLNIDGEEAVLVIRSVGFNNKEVTATAGGTFNVVLQSDQKSLEEVVVTALGIKREKKSLGYSVQEVKGDQLMNNKDNVVSALSGKVSGVQVTNSTGLPGSSANIVIRGNQSITGSNQPLFVIDGIPIDNSVNSTESNLQGVQNSNRAIDLNPDDIATMSVLKGPAATALYGIGASNGAIVITTKKGANTGGKINVIVNSAVTWSKVNKLPEFQDTYAQGTGGKYRGPDIGTSRSWGPNVKDLTYYNNTSDPNDPLNPGNYLWSYLGALTYKNDVTDPSLPGSTTIVGHKDPHGTGAPVRIYDIKDFFVTGMTYDNSVSFFGGTDKGSYRVSFSNQQNNGVVPHSEFRKTTFRLSADSKLTDKLNSNATIAYINSGGTRIPQGGGLSGIGLGLYRTPITFDNKNGATDPSDPKAYILPDGAGSQRAFTGVNGDGSHTPVFDNPYWVINKEQFKDDVNRVMGSGTISYDPLSWLNLSYRIGGDVYSDRRKQPYPIYSANLPAGQLYEDQYLNRIINSDLFVTFKKQFRDWDFALMYDNNLYSYYNEHINPVGSNLTFQNFDNLSNAVNIQATEGVFKRRRASNIGDLRVAYKDQLFLHASGRQDKSSTLPPGNNIFFYPAVDLGWVFTELNGLKSSKALTFGKLRVSYAEVGNDAPIYYLYPNFVSSFFIDGFTNGITFPFQTANGNVGGFMANGTSSAAGSRLNNPNLKPERIKQFETGIELRFFGDRLGADVTYYRKKAIDEILAVPTTASTGYGAVVLNAGNITNNGVEVQLNGTPIKTRDFRWDININWSRNRSLVGDLYPGVDQIGLGGYTGAVASAMKGQPFGAIFGNKYLRDSKGNLVIEDRADQGAGAYGFPIPDLSKSVSLGDPNPDWLAGIANTFTYKGFSLYALLDIKHGGMMWNGTRGALVTYGRAKETENRGTTTVFQGVAGHLDDNGNLVTSGKTNDVKAVLGQAWYTGNGGGFGPVGEPFMENSGFVRLREVNLSYKFNPRLLGGTKVIKGLELGFVARNLWLHTKYTGVDPDGSLTGAGNAQGLDYFMSPGTKSYAVQLKLSL
ncbi:SusC/RagA family TonB-linked outer membrane protein [Chitinophaga vietnamensis]|uniref:SusC/RagA family TonB-linked outer membrane protein n=1 Tax=Chitinophaga vietnamensis TaxID=2593957 RepID=UPI001177AD87|nr:SusC/RagA family TonB-linked outer membrane protein [Chitinophaga vietnamensis]